MAWFWVGEAGPEIVNLPKGTLIIPRARTDEAESPEQED